MTSQDLLKHEPQLAEGKYGDGIIIGCWGCKWVPPGIFDEKEYEESHKKRWPQFVEHVARL